MEGLDLNQFLKPKLSHDSESLNIPEYDFIKGIEKVLEMIQEKLLTQQKPIIVEIAGGSASGKTSAVASKIKEVMGDKAFIFSIDDYCYERASRNSRTKSGNVLNDDHPEALNLELLKVHLKKLKQGETIEKPIFDLKKAKQSGTMEVHPHKVIIVEGLFALNDLIANEGDIKIFVETSTYGRLMRRLLRDTERTGKKPADILKYFLEVIVQMHEKHIQSTKNKADLIIKNEYNPEIEGIPKLGTELKNCILKYKS